MRAVFMGTPEFAVPTLRLLAEHHDVSSVITQPDRPSGRGNKLTAPPVKTCALELGLPVYQPERIKAAEATEHLKAKAPDVIVVVGYGQIIPQRIIDLPEHGCVNVHSSLLPKWRGAAPMNWAIVNGDIIGGVTTMLIEKRLDAGDILLQREAPISPGEGASDFAARLAPIGADLLIETLSALASGSVEPRSQDESEATYAPIIKREDGRIDWTQSSPEIYNRLRGFDPWPGVFSTFRGKRIQIRAARPISQPVSGVGQPGRLTFDGRSLFAECGSGRLELVEVQIEGKQRLAAADFARGHRIHDSEILGA